jgi:hypothetical protein
MGRKIQNFAWTMRHEAPREEALAPPLALPSSFGPSRDGSAKGLCLQKQP